MAKRVRVIETLIDDLDGTELPEGTGQSFNYTWQGVDYEIDLSDEHGGQLQAMMQPILDASRRVGGRKQQQTSKRPRPAVTTTAAVQQPELPAPPSDQPYAEIMNKRRFLKEVRAWARLNGFPDQGDNGRLKEGVREAWDEAHPDRPVPRESPSATTLRRERIAAEQAAIAGMKEG